MAAHVATLAALALMGTAAGVNGAAVARQAAGVDSVTADSQPSQVAEAGTSSQPSNVYIHNRSSARVKAYQGCGIAPGKYVGKVHPQPSQQRQIVAYEPIYPGRAELTLDGVPSSENSNGDPSVFCYLAVQGTDAYLWCRQKGTGTDYAWLSPDGLEKTKTFSVGDCNNLYHESYMMGKLCYRGVVNGANKYDYYIHADNDGAYSELGDDN